jgi:hypothetical protein
MFLLYMWVSVLYCTFFNAGFLSEQLSGQTMTWGLALKFVMPLVSLMTFDISWMQVYIFFFSLHLAAALLTSVLLIYHVRLVKPFWALPGTNTFPITMQLVN